MTEYLILAERNWKDHTKNVLFFRVHLFFSYINSLNTPKRFCLGLIFVKLQFVIHLCDRFFIYQLDVPFVVFLYY